RLVRLGPSTTPSPAELCYRLGPGTHRHRVDLGRPDAHGGQMADLLAAHPQPDPHRLCPFVCSHAAVVVEDGPGGARTVGFSHAANDPLARGADRRLVSLAQTAELLPVVPEPRSSGRTSARHARGGLGILLGMLCHGLSCGLVE